MLVNKEVSKKGKVIFFVFIFLMILSFNFCKAEKSLFLTDIKVDIHEDSTFDVLITHQMDFDVWSTKDVNIGVGKEMQNVIISDDLGIITPKNITEYDNSIGYKFDTHYSGSVGYKKIYISSKGNSLEKLNDYLYKLNLIWGVSAGDSSDEDVILTLNFSKSMSLIDFTGGETNVTETNSSIKVSYHNPSGNFDFILLSENELDTFIQISDESKTFFVENKSLLVEGFKDVLKNRDCILNYPLYEKDTMVILLGNTSEFIENASGFYSGELIMIDKNQYPTQDNEIYLSKEKIGGILMHELTHYSNAFNYVGTHQLKWVDEGSAVYSEINYLDRIFDINNLSDYRQLNLYQIKPKSPVLNYWYNFHTDFIKANYSYNISESDLYSLYGFVINHYAQTYGEEALISFFNDLKTKSNSLKGTEDFSEEKLNEAVINSLIIYSKQNISKEDIFFPDTALFINNYSQFEEKMAPFIMPTTISEEKTNFGDVDLISVIIALVAVLIVPIIIIALPIILIIFIIKKLKSNRGKKKKINIF
jgi:hypothetical protein